MTERRGRPLIRWLLGASAILASIFLGGVIERIRSRQAPLRCERIDASELESTKIPEASEWMKDAYTCNIGSYQIVLPAKASGEHLWLRRAGENLVFRSERGVLSLGDAPHLSAFLRDKDGDGHFDSISYDTWKAKTHFVSAMDWNLDGQPDTRATESPDKSLINEAWVQGTWRRIDLDRGFRLTGQPNLRLQRDSDGNSFIVDEAKK